MTKSKYGKILSYATAVLTVLCGIALIVCAVHLFFTGGDKPYTREKVENYLSYLTIPAVITILLIISGKVIDFLEQKGAKEKAKRTEYEMISGYAKRFDIDKVDEELKRAITEEQNFRLAINSVFHLLSLLFVCCAVIYIAFFAEFTVSNLNKDVLSAFAVTLPLVALGVGAQIPRVYLCESSARTEKELWLRVVKSGQKPMDLPNADISANETKRLLIIRLAVAALAVILIVLGIFNGGMADVLAKAIKICTECIGLG